MSDDDALVEKAAAALAHAYGDEAHVAEYHDEARAVLDAVAPTIRADAWDEGYRSGASNVRRQWSDEPHLQPTPNPYRSDDA